MKGIAKSVARQTGQLVRDVAKQTLKDIGEIPKQAPRQAVGQYKSSQPVGSKQKLVKLPSLSGIDVKKEAAKVPESVVKQITGGVTPQLTSEEKQRLESERLKSLQRIDAEMAKYREERRRRKQANLQQESLQAGKEQQRVIKPGESFLPSSSRQTPTGPGARGKKGPEVRKSKH